MNVRDQVVAVLVLLQSTESHLGAGNIFLWVLEVLELWQILALGLCEHSMIVTHEGIVVPLNTLCLVGIGIRVSLNGSSVASEKSEQVRTDLVSLSFTEGVALSTSSLEEVGPLLCVSCKKTIISKNSAFHFL